MDKPIKTKYVFFILIYLSFNIFASIDYLAPTSITNQNPIDQYFTNLKNKSFEFFKQIRSSQKELTDWNDYLTQEPKLEAMKMSFPIIPLDLITNNPAIIKSMIIMIQNINLIFRKTLLAPIQLKQLWGVLCHSYRLAKLSIIYWDFNRRKYSRPTDTQKMASRIIGQLFHDLEKRRPEILTVIFSDNELKELDRNIMEQHTVIIKQTLLEMLNDPTETWLDELMQVAHIPTIFKVIDPDISEKELAHWISQINNPRYLTQKQDHLLDISTHQVELMEEGRVAKIFDTVDALFDLNRNYRRKYPIPTIAHVQQIVTPLSGSEKIKKETQKFLSSEEFLHYLQEDIFPLWLIHHANSYSLALAQSLIQPILPIVKIQNREDERSLRKLFNFYQGLSILADKDLADISNYISKHLQDENWLHSIDRMLRPLYSQLNKSNLISTDPRQNVREFLLDSLKLIFTENELEYLKLSTFTVLNPIKQIYNAA